MKEYEWQMIINQPFRVRLAVCWNIISQNGLRDDAYYKKCQEAYNKAEEKQMMYGDAFNEKPAGKGKQTNNKYGPASTSGEMANSKGKSKMKAKDGSYETNKGSVKVDKKSKKMK